MERRMSTSERDLVSGELRYEQSDTLQREPRCPHSTSAARKGSPTAYTKPEVRATGGVGLDGQERVDGGMRA